MRRVFVLRLNDDERELLERALRAVAAGNGDLRRAADILEQLEACSWTPRQLKRLLEGRKK